MTDLREGTDTNSLEYHQQMRDNLLNISDLSEESIALDEAYVVSLKDTGIQLFFALSLEFTKESLLKEEKDTKAILAKLFESSNDINKNAGIDEIYNALRLQKSLHKKAIVLLEYIQFLKVLESELLYSGGEGLLGDETEDTLEEGDILDHNAYETRVENTFVVNDTGYNSMLSVIDMFYEPDCVGAYRKGTLTLSSCHEDGDSIMDRMYKYTTILAAIVPVMLAEELSELSREEIEQRFPGDDRQLIHTVLFQLGRHQIQGLTFGTDTNYLTLQEEGLLLSGLLTKQDVHQLLEKQGVTDLWQHFMASPKPYNLTIIHQQADNAFTLNQKYFLILEELLPLILHESRVGVDYTYLRSLFDGESGSLAASLLKLTDGTSVKAVISNIPQSTYIYLSSSDAYDERAFGELQLCTYLKEQLDTNQIYTTKVLETYCTEQESGRYLSSNDLEIELLHMGILKGSQVPYVRNITESSKLDTLTYYMKTSSKPLAESALPVLDILKRAGNFDKNGKKIVKRVLTYINESGGISKHEFEKIFSTAGVGDTMQARLQILLEDSILLDTGNSYQLAVGRKEQRKKIKKSDELTEQIDPLAGLKEHLNDITEAINFLVTYLSTEATITYPRLLEVCGDNQIVDRLFYIMQEYGLLVSRKGVGGNVSYELVQDGQEQRNKIYTRLTESSDEPMYNFDTFTAQEEVDKDKQQLLIKKCKEACQQIIREEKKLQEIGVAYMKEQVFSASDEVEYDDRGKVVLPQYPDEELRQSNVPLVDPHTGLTVYQYVVILHDVYEQVKESSQPVSIHELSGDRLLVDYAIDIYLGNGSTNKKLYYYTLCKRLSDAFQEIYLGYSEPLEEFETELYAGDQKDVDLMLRYTKEHALGVKDNHVLAEDGPISDEGETGSTSPAFSMEGLNTTKFSDWLGEILKSDEDGDLGHTHQIQFEEHLGDDETIPINTGWSTVIHCLSNRYEDTGQRTWFTSFEDERLVTLLSHERNRTLFLGLLIISTHIGTGFGDTELGKLLQAIRDNEDTLPDLLNQYINGLLGTENITADQSAVHEAKGTLYTDIQKIIDRLLNSQNTLVKAINELSGQTDELDTILTKFAWELDLYATQFGSPEEDNLSIGGVDPHIIGEKQTVIPEEVGLTSDVEQLFRLFESCKIHQDFGVWKNISSEKLHDFALIITSNTDLKYAFSGLCILASTNIVSFTGDLTLNHFLQALQGYDVQVGDKLLAYLEHINVDSLSSYVYQAKEMFKVKINDLSDVEKTLRTEQLAGFLTDNPDMIELRKNSLTNFDLFDPNLSRTFRPLDFTYPKVQKSGDEKKVNRIQREEYEGQIPSMLVRFGDSFEKRGQTFSVAMRVYKRVYAMSALLSEFTIGDLLASLRKDGVNVTMNQCCEYILDLHSMGIINVREGKSGFFQSPWIGSSSHGLKKNMLLCKNDFTYFHFPNYTREITRHSTGREAYEQHIYTVVELSLRQFDEIPMSVLKQQCVRENVYDGNLVTQTLIRLANKGYIASDVKPVPLPNGKESVRQYYKKGPKRDDLVDKTSMLVEFA